MISIDDPSGTRIGVLDVGSNSVRLLVADVADGQVLSIHKERITCRLMSGFSDGLLDEGAIERTARAIELLAGKARALGAQTVAGFGTSALREGTNRVLLIARAERAGVPIAVVSGEREADLAYAGAAPAGRRGVIDIGGGSTELSAGEDGRVLVARSAQIGAVRLCEALGGAMRPDDMLLAARAALSPAWDAIASHPSDGWTGVGGTVTTLAAMTLALSPYDPARVEGFPVTAQAARGWLGRLCSMPLEARKQIVGLNPDRADIIPFGAAILCAFFDLSNVPHISASDSDNLLGYARMGII